MEPPKLPNVIGGLLVPPPEENVNRGSLEESLNVGLRKAKPEVAPTVVGVATLAEGPAAPTEGVEAPKLKGVVVAACELEAAAPKLKADVAPPEVGVEAPK